MTPTQHKTGETLAITLAGNIRNTAMVVAMVVSVAMLTLVATSCTNSANNANSANNSNNANSANNTGSTSTTTAANSSNTITVRIPQDMDSLDPHKASAAGTQEVMFNVFRGLLTPTPNGDLVGGIADEYTLTNNRTRYTFHIRNNALFHNGNPVRANDVVYTYRRLMGEIDPSIRYKSLDTVQSVVALDPFTVRIDISQANNSIFTEFTRAIIPADSGSTIGTHPIGAGPYRFVSYSPTQSITLQAYDKFYLGEANITNVVFRIIPDITTTILAANNNNAKNSLDIIPDLPYNNFDMVNSTQFDDIVTNLNMVQILAFNHTYPPLADKFVRQAITQAINKTRIINLLTNAEGIPLASHMTPLMSRYYNRSLTEPFPYNTTQAQLKLLQADPEFRNGFNLTIVAPANYQLHVDTAVLIAEDLNKIGIKTTIKKVEWGVWLNDVYKNANYQATVIGFAGKLDPYQTLRRYQSNYSNNFFHYQNETFDKLLQQGLQSNIALSQKAYKQAQTILANDTAAYFIMDPIVHTAVRKNISGWTTYPISNIDIYALSKSPS